MPYLRYRYFQPADGRYHYASETEEAVQPDYTLVYTGNIPASEEDSTEDLLDRLTLRHSAQARPGEARPCGTGDVLDLGSRGAWQVLTFGFRAFPQERLAGKAEPELQKPLPHA